MQISQELFDLLTTALEFSRITEGAFDITYASVGFMYDFRAHKKPTEEEIESALPAVNYHHVVLDAKARTVFFTQPGVRIDLGGIGKGYAVDRGIAILQQRGIPHALVTAGGDSRIIGDRFGKPWIVGIRHPDDKARVIAKIPLVDTAMSTSGDYERYFDEDGVRYHHIIDPRTGKSASKVRSATILASTATRTDGLSKTAFVLGAEEAMKIYEKLDDVDAILVTPDGRVLYSKGLEPAAQPRGACGAGGARAMKKLLWFGVALLGAYALGGIALHRGESINAHVDHRRGGLRLRARLSLLQRVGCGARADARRHARNAGGAAEQRPRLRADATAGSCSVTISPRSPGRVR